jgi:hypothetical protein
MHRRVRLPARQLGPFPIRPTVSMPEPAWSGVPRYLGRFTTERDPHPRAGPRVRIRLPPGASPLRTRFSAGQGHRLDADRPTILPRDLQRCREAKRDAARCSRSRGPRYAENRSAEHATPGSPFPGCAGAARVASRREASSVRELGPCRGKLIVNMAIPFLTMTKAN